MAIELIKTVLFWLNSFPPESGISSTYIPRTILTGTNVDINNYPKILFCTCVKSHEDRVKTNTTQERLCGSICLPHTGNLQGTYQFIFLNNGERIKRWKWNKLLVLDSFLKRVKELSKTKSDTGGLPLLDIHRYEITNNTKYDEVYIEKVHGSNTDGNISVHLCQSSFP